jgi:uncharacterized protein (DUF952 family)
MPPMIYHLALVSDWDAALAAGEYRVSTLGATLEQEGFIHASFAHQTRGVAERYYAGVRDPLVLLEVVESLLTAPWRIDAVPGSAEGFPHVYGPIDVRAVVRATPVTRTEDGTWTGLPSLQA